MMDMERKETSCSQTTNSKQNKLSRWFVSAARNVLHFFGIQNHTTDDDTWEQSILNRIQVIVLSRNIEVSLKLVQGLNDCKI